MAAKKVARKPYNAHRKKDASAPKRKYERKIKPEKRKGINLVVTTREADALKAIVAQLSTESVSRQSAFGRAIALQVGEEDLCPGMTLHAFSQRVNAARRGGLITTEEWVAKVCVFSPGVGLPAISVLWFRRVK